MQFGGQAPVVELRRIDGTEKKHGCRIHTLGVDSAMSEKPKEVEGWLALRREAVKSRTSPAMNTARNVPGVDLNNSYLKFQKPRSWAVALLG